ncbi:unnamed protein product [Fraxinus pennsylvanica]|uniref:Uncharacterized protein n=1 Tax=Fraxinus pennsylvanica TaxID=56036 RepID=A0AAD2E2H5_9LAMI|nr:unnamed protein product [Fraxinus pennsylvanica]
MLASQSPLFGHQSIPPPKSGRKPLQPKNTLLAPITPNENPKPKQNPDCIEISLADNSNKENFAPSDYYATPIKAPIESFDASLAEELSAIREKLERLKIDKEKTEETLKERDLILDMKMKELVQRGEVQKHLEIEVDRFTTRTLRFGPSWHSKRPWIIKERYLITFLMGMSEMGTIELALIEWPEEHIYFFSKPPVIIRLCNVILS